jgi:hypothetical protein
MAFSWRSLVVLEARALQLALAAEFRERSNQGNTVFLKATVVF